ncbi:unnamed protein product, partial [Symbiodinium sp. KB8]
LPIQLDLCDSPTAPFDAAAHGTKAICTSEGVCMTVQDTEAALMLMMLGLGSCFLMMTPLSAFWRVTAAADAHDARLGRRLGWEQPGLMLMMLVFLAMVLMDINFCPHLGREQLQLMLMMLGVLVIVMLLMMPLMMLMMFVFHGALGVNGCG